MARDFYWVRLGDVPQWLLETPTRGSGEAFDEPWMFADGRVLDEPGEMKALIATAGKRRAFVFSVIERAPIASQAIANVFRALAPNDVQLFPVMVEGEADPFFVVNATKVIDCIDEARCREVHHADEDDSSPDHEGEYQWIYGLRIDPSKTEGAHVFRPRKFKTAFIVSEDVKNALEGVGNLGVSFERVTGAPESH
ncbi:imm11 family protein [Corallococcus interemptor]|uniref:imm11 family protein n=1 Tax=Corallococcus interemptor TaxID=2316720 RepID=UPI003D086C21